MTTTDTPTAGAAAERDPYMYRPYSNLAGILREHLPENDAVRKAASYAAISTASAIVTIGKLLLHCEARELAPADIRGVGDLITTLGEVALELANASEPGWDDTSAALAAQGGDGMSTTTTGGRLHRLAGLLSLLEADAANAGNGGNEVPAHYRAEVLALAVELVEGVAGEIGSGPPTPAGTPPA